mgnify:CR=1 FL=1
MKEGRYGRGNPRMRSSQEVPASFRLTQVGERQFMQRWSIGLYFNIKLILLHKYTILVDIVDEC